jgi:hypothetical protein
VIGLFAYSWDELARDFHRREETEVIAHCFVGLFLWAVTCAALWYGLLLPKFRAVSRREASIRSDALEEPPT